MIKRIAGPALLFMVVSLCVASYAGMIFTTAIHAKWPGDLHPVGWSKGQEEAMNAAHAWGGYFQYDDIRETVFDIQFNSRGDFEKIWPAILSLKSKGAPLILRKGPSSYRQEPSLVRGVHIIYPLRDQKGLYHPGIDPNLLNSILASADPLPEYVKITDGHYMPFLGDLPSPLPAFFKLSEPLYRVRTDIILVIDANVVDLNRIPLPKNTPIIDQRF
jgi:hypothetical protein